MSHYMYKKKMYIELSDGRILPLCQYADSSVWDPDRKRYPTSWCISPLAGDTLLCTKEAFAKAAQAEYDRQVALLTNFRNQFSPDKTEPIGPESYHYGGTTYPGGGKLKNMRAFFSTRKTIPIAEFLKDHSFLRLKLSPLRPGSYEAYQTVEVLMHSESDFLKAQDMYEMLKHDHPDSIHIYVGVYGMDA